MSISDDLKAIGFDGLKASVYEVLVGFNFRTAGQISSYTQKELSQVQSALSELKNDGFVKEIKMKSNDSSIYIPVAPQIALSADISSKLSQKLSELSSKVSDQWKKAESQIQGKVNDLFQQNETSIFDLKTRMDGVTQDRLNSLDNIVSKESQGLNELTVKVQNLIKDEVIPPLKDVATDLSSSSQALLQTRDNMINEVNSSTEVHRKRVAEASDLAIQEIQDYINELALNVTARITVLNQGMAGLKAPTTENLENLKLNLAKAADNLVALYISETKEISKESIGQAVTNIEKEEKIVSDSFNTMSKELDTSIKQLKENEGIIKKKISESSIGVVDRSSKNLRVSVENLRKGLSTAVATTQDTSVKTLSSILDKTSKDIANAEAALTKSVNQGQLTLETELDTLVTSLNKGLNQKFGEVKSQNNNFKQSLSNASSASVNSVQTKLTEITSFITEFLNTTHTDLKEEFSSLQESVKSKLEEISATASEERNNTFEEAKKELTALNLESKKGLEKFSSDLKGVLEEIRTTLSNDLNESQETFDNSIESSVAEYQAASSEIISKQQEQINAIQEEANSLLSSAENSKRELVDELSKMLKEAKDTNLDRFNTSVRNSFDKVTRDARRLKDSSSVDFDGFKNTFRNNISGLMSKIPSQIEDLFTNHEDKLHNFDRSFTSFKSRVHKQLSDLLQYMEANPKVAGKKKPDQQAKIQEQRLLISDFQRLVKEIEPFIKTEIDDTEMTYEDVSKSLNKTVQFEIENVEGFMDKIKGDIVTIVDGGVNELNSSKDTFLKEFSDQASDALFTATETIKKSLVTKFDDPLNSIINKANFVAKGTEGSDSENRVLKSQGVLIDQINSAIESLTSHLKDGYTKILSSIDEQINAGFEKSDHLKSDYMKLMQKLLEDQLKSIDMFALKMANSIKEVANSTNDNLGSSINNSTMKLEEIVKSKNQEVNQVVTASIEKLQSDTATQVEKINTFSTEFNSTLDSIKGHTSSQLGAMVNASKTSMKENTSKLVESLKKTTATSTTAIATSRKSLADKVGKPLKKVNTDVEGLVRNFDASINKSKNMLTKELETSLNTAFKPLQDVFKGIESSRTSSETFVKTLGKIKTRVEKNLSSIFDVSISKMSDHSTAHKAKVNETYTNEVKNLFGFIDQTFDLIEMQVSDLQTEVNGATENALSNVSLQISNSVEQVRGDIVGAAQTVLDVLNTSSDKASSSLNSVVDKVNNASESFGTLIDTKFTTHSDKISERFAKYVEDLKGELNLDNTQTFEKFKAASDKFNSDLKSVADAGMSEVEDTLNGIPAIITDTLDAAGKSINLLSTISKGASSIEPKLIDSTYVESSKDAVIANLNGLIKRTKSKIEIVAPSISWLDDSEFDTFSRRNITIITDPSQHTDRDKMILKKIQDSGTPLTLKEFDPSRTSLRSGLNMIIVSRDNEEAMIAHPVDNPDPFGVVTQDEEFVMQFSTILANFRSMRDWKF